MGGELKVSLAAAIASVFSALDKVRNIIIRILPKYIYQKSPGEVRAMERVEWLKQMRDKLEALYDHLSPGYWVKVRAVCKRDAHRSARDGFPGGI